MVIGNFLILGEFLIDDYSLDGKSPHKIACKIGAQFLHEQNKIHVEYIRINKWVGNYIYPELQMKDYSILLGHPIGPDAHKISLKLYLYLAGSHLVHKYALILAL